MTRTELKYYQHADALLAVRRGMTIVRAAWLYGQNVDALARAVQKQRVREAAVAPGYANYTPAPRRLTPAEDDTSTKPLATSSDTAALVAQVGEEHGCSAATVASHARDDEWPGWDRRRCTAADRTRLDVPASSTSRFVYWVAPGARPHGSRLDRP
jgi:hypothetical protein